MLDASPKRMPQTAPVIASTPRHQAKPADPCAMVLFGATGDLTKRLVMPALYNLARTKVLPEQFALIGVARADRTTESWRNQHLPIYPAGSAGPGEADALLARDRRRWRTIEDDADGKSS
jgi:glucose-6-phosphate 1-dehydrogenase